MTTITVPDDTRTLYVPLFDVDLGERRGRRSRLDGDAARVVASMVSTNAMIDRLRAGEVLVVHDSRMEGVGSRPDVVVRWNLVTELFHVQRVV